MAVMNAVQILMLLWSFTAVCQADAGVCSVSCDNVTATVGNEVILTCRVSEQCIEEHVKLHKFQSLNNNSEYCKEEHPNNTCETKKTFTCSYTPDTAKKETFRFFLQTTSSRKEPEFTVEISDNQYRQGGNPGPEKSNVSAVSVGVGCIIILIIIIILTIIIIYKKQTGGCQKMMFLGTREKDHDRDTEKVENHF